MRISDWSADVCASDLSGETEQVAGRLDQRIRGLEARAGNEARTKQWIRRQAGTRCLQPEAGERLEDDVCKDLPVVEDQRESTDIEHLADEPGEDVGALVHRPPEARQGDIDGDQDRGEEGDVACQQTEARIDIGDEGLDRKSTRLNSSH